MASLFPASVDTFSTPTAGSATSSPSHATLHVNENNAITNAQTYMGMTLISSTTIGSTVSSVTVSSAFSATYDNYLVQLSGGVGSADANLRLTLGSTVTGYYAGGLYVSYTASTVTGVNTNNGAFIDIGYGSTNALSGRGEIESPFLAKRTIFRTNAISSSTSYPFGIFGGFLDDATSYTAFTITPSGGTMTGGTIRVYGYRI